MQPGGDHMECLQGVQRALRDHLNIVHATVQIETTPCGDGDDCLHVRQSKTG
jgi:Co/Zn/Cd efflux system component